MTLYRLSVSVIALGLVTGCGRKSGGAANLFMIRRVALASKAIFETA